MKINNILNSNGKFHARKYIFEKENKTVEFTYVNRLDKHIICISCMFGCPIGCSFCASGHSYQGKLNTEEMISAIKDIIKNERISSNEKLLLSFMGSGEPLLNVKAVKQVIDFFQRFTNICFSISISGIDVEKILLFNNLMNIKVQFSLHNPDNFERKQMIHKTENLDKIFRILSKLNNKIEINYILLEGINDSKINAEKLVALINHFKFPLKINEYHQINDSIKESSKKENFLKVLDENKINYELYSTDAVDVKGGCGQLVSQLLK